MPIQRARSIDELYTRVSDADIALSTEGPLTLALDNRLDEARLGRLAATPRSHASGEMVPTDDRPLFLELIETTDLSWKTAALATSNVLDAWDRTGDYQAVLDGPFDTPEMETAMETISAVDSTYNAAATEQLDGDTQVAVLGERLFTPLDRSYLPADYDSISLFDSEATFDVPEFRIFDSTKGIIRTILNAVDEQNATDIAVVVDPSSRYATQLESAFAANDIPYRGGVGFEEQTFVRVFLRLLRAAFDSDDLRLGEIRPTLIRLGIDSPVTESNRRLSTVDDEAVQQVVSFIDAIPQSTFGNVAREFAEFIDTPVWELETELENLGLKDEQVTADLVSALSFYLESFEVPFGESDEGVLLASATSSVYVDRPTVFYVGLDKSWERQIPDRPWIDEEREDRLNLLRFQLLIQNGSERHYLAVNSRGGEPVTPCLYFEELFERDVDEFRDLPSTEHTVRAGSSQKAFSHSTPAGFERPEPVESLSQSSLNTLVNSPRDYFMTELLESATDEYRRRGTLFHDVAELYVVAPSIVEENREAVLDWLVTNQSPFINNHDIEPTRTMFDTGLDLLMSYLDSVSIQERTYSGYTPLDTENELAASLGVEIDSTITEQWFKNLQLGIHGVIDLIQSPSTIVDYKTGTQSTAGSALSDANIEEISDTPNFQPLHYLSFHREEVPDTKLTFSLVHFLDSIDTAVVDRDSVSIHDSVTDIEYFPGTFTEYIQQEEIYEWLWTDLSENNNRRKVLESMGYEAYLAFFESNRYPDEDSKDAVLETSQTAEFVSHSIEHVGDWKYSKRGARSTMKKLYDLREGTLFSTDIDAYQSFLQTCIDELNEYRSTRFPVGDPNERRLNHPMLILEGDG